MQELELRIETQKQTLQQRDESIKKLLEMLQSKGEGNMKSNYLLNNFDLNIERSFTFWSKIFNLYLHL